MRPDRFADYAKKAPWELTSSQAAHKMTVLINIYHSIEHRYGSEDQKESLRELVEAEIYKLKKRVGSSLAANCEWYLRDKQAWNATKESAKK